MDNEEWEKSKGVVCKNCNKESFQIIDGLCYRCSEYKSTKEVMDIETVSMRRYYKREFKRGTVILSRMRENLL